MTELEQLAGEYSDFFKEAYGFRPRRDVSAWTFADFQKEFDHLGRVCEENAKAREAAEQLAIADFEARVLQVVARGAGDRATAIRWLAEAENVDGDMEHLCYCLGLPYGYFR